MSFSAAVDYSYGNWHALGIPILVIVEPLQPLQSVYSRRLGHPLFAFFTLSSPGSKAARFAGASTVPLLVFIYRCYLCEWVAICIVDYTFTETSLELAPPLLFFHMRLLYDICPWMLQLSHYHEP